MKTNTGIINKPHLLCLFGILLINSQLHDFAFTMNLFAQEQSSDSSPKGEAMDESKKNSWQIKIDKLKAAKVSGNYAEAITIGNALLIEYADGQCIIEIRYHVALAYEYSKNYMKALEYFRYIADRYPPSPEAVLSLQRIAILKDSIGSSGNSIEIIRNGCRGNTTMIFSINENNKRHLQIGGFQNESNKGSTGDTSNKN